MAESDLYNAHQRIWELERRVQRLERVMEAARKVAHDNCIPCVTLPLVELDKAVSELEEEVSDA